MRTISLFSWEIILIKSPSLPDRSGSFLSFLGNSAGKREIRVWILFIRVRRSRGDLQPLWHCIGEFEYTGGRFHWFKALCWSRCSLKYGNRLKLDEMDTLPNIVVMGATGNQGLAVIQHLYAVQKANIYAVSRGPSPPPRNFRRMIHSMRHKIHEYLA